MTTLEYEDSGCREKQIQKEKDEFAIEFAEWIFKNKGNMEMYKITTIDNSYILKSTKELLEIYKKEKGL